MHKNNTYFSVSLYNLAKSIMKTIARIDNKNSNYFMSNL